MKKCLFILLLLPLCGHAEGQDGYSIALDLITFVIVFAVWAIIVFPTLFILNKYRTKNLSFNFKAIFVIVTGLMALFVFSMVKHDSQPYHGPIDSIIYERKQKQDSLYFTEDYPDSTITKINSIDTSENGIYIWLNHRPHFVRKNTTNFYSWQKEDSLTMSIVRRWANAHKLDSANINKR